ncbi:NUDIX domain-containing protein [Nocardioides sp.]|uniref:NUDIX hydrolase n=1 Tax=Nocardioides sp. TaxID=35761 RepID=UPI0035147AF7
MTPSPGPGVPDILAAGVVVHRPGREVLLVHRPKYDDWSFPKGKLDRGEHPAGAAVREVAEETGLHVRLTQPLPDQRYPLAAAAGRATHKTVQYWTGRVVGSDDVAGYRPNDEIDQVRWVPLAEAPQWLTYDHDRETLAAAQQLRQRTSALIVLRHARARSRSTWRGEDRERPLLAAGHRQAHALVPVLAAYGVTEVYTSPATRCRQTVAPLAHALRAPVLTRRPLAEERADAAGVQRIVEEVLARPASSLLCSHRPVLPWVFDALGLEPLALEPGEMLVLHRRQRRLLSFERHLVA